MNQIVQLRSPEFLCEECNVQCTKQSDWNRHIKTAKHLSIGAQAEQFDCSYCNYSTNNKKDWKKHLSTKKHNERDEKKYDCSTCDRVFNNYKTCWAHKQKCSSKANDKNIIDKLINENQELRSFFVQEIRNIISEQNNDTQKLLTELVKNVNVTNNNTITQNNNNQKFNINVFLNEQCKDAMNFSDFIKGIEVSREDLENNAQLGFVNGISKIILDNLRQLSINQRPIHCTDIKRETMYIKDDDKWTKETGPAKLNTAILTISQKSTRTLLDWKKENPDYQNHDSEFCTRCIVIQRNSMAGFDRDTYYPKVIRAIAKEVIVDK
jgi:hypothetical protein